MKESRERRVFLNKSSVLGEQARHDRLTMLYFEINTNSCKLGFNFLLWTLSMNSNHWHLTIHSFHGLFAYVPKNLLEAQLKSCLQQLQLQTWRSLTSKLPRKERGQMCIQKNMDGHERRIYSKNYLLKAVHSTTALPAGHFGWKFQTKFELLHSFQAANHSQNTPGRSLHHPKIHFWCDPMSKPHQDPVGGTLPPRRKVHTNHLLVINIPVRTTGSLTSRLTRDVCQTHHHASDPQSLGRVHLTEVTERFCSATASNAFLILPFPVLNQTPTDWTTNRRWNLISSFQ